MQHGHVELAAHHREGRHGPVEKGVLVGVRVEERRHRVAVEENRCRSVRLAELGILEA
jgi:hypothetical protein